jgi:hypothetical protein
LIHRALAPYLLRFDRDLDAAWPNLQAFWPVLLAGVLRFRRRNAVCADILYGIRPVGRAAFQE